MILRTRLKLGRCAISYDSALRDDYGTTTDRGNLFEDMGRDDDDLVARKIFNELANMVFLIWVEAVGRFVQD